MNERQSGTEKRTDANLLCPACKVGLVMSERQNIEIDYCPNCRGVWLDRGELDKIIERSLSTERSTSARQPVEDRDYEEAGRYREGHHGGGHHGSRRRSWLRDLFD
ncbi:zf-TFIIB domain-containing protein [Steroidobacter sp.]|uniref:TFIIB-type zinc ribbon-containing protein n=1 Tax=Steroidobacter sp. TaxID=1978227 RepID=UPI001A6427AA|nr:zf-TFIIB domain-containing protein [Steroidobacter sp.]MBL8272088.1 zf-TFIIB domain-containing protein [Steroidobacter sp.]